MRMYGIPIKPAADDTEKRRPDSVSQWVAAGESERRRDVGAEAGAGAGKPSNDVTPAPVARPTREEAEAAVATLLRWIGDDPTREGLVDTPARVVRAYEEIFGGYAVDPAAALGRTFEDVSGYADIVLVKDIDFHSHCEHHMVPIVGKAHVAYLPDDKVLGLSKIARVVDIFGRRLQTQEAMTQEIADTIMETLHPRGVAVMLEAEHLCMSMRGIRTRGSKTLTTAFLGSFADDPSARTRFLTMVYDRR